MSLTLTLKDNGGNPVSGEGTSITLNNTTETNFTKFDLYGDTEQQTYSGKNLVYTVPTTDGGLTWTYDSLTGTGTVKGTATRSYSIAGRISDLSLPSGNYTISIQNSIGRAIGVGIRIGGSRTAKYISAGDTTNTFAAEGTITDLDVCMTGLVTNTYYEFTYKLQLETGLTPTSFEPYVGGMASPNPDYPQEVKTVTGEQTITVSNGQGESQSYPINLGKNLFDKNVISSGYLVGRTDGILAANSSYGASDFIRVQEGETYTFTGFNYWYSAYYDGNKQYVGYPTNTATITVPAGVSYIRTSLLLTSLDTAQFEKGSTATTYAPYIQAFGKNLLNPATLTADGRLNADGTVLSGATGFSTSDYISVEPNTTYTITRNAASSGFFGNLCQYNSNKTKIGNREYWDNSTTWPYRTTTSEDTHYIRVSDQTTLFGTSFQIEKGSSATTYEPNISGQLELCEISDYQDYLYKSEGNWYVHKEIGKSLIDGTQGTVQRITTNRFNVSGFPTGYKMQKLANFSLADKYQTVVQYDTNGDFDSGTSSMNYAFGFHPTSSGVRIKDTRYNTVDDYKTWLATNPIIVYYALANQTDTQITYEPLVAQLEAIYNTAHSYNGATIVTSSSQYLPAIMDVTIGASTNEVTYTETELSNPLTITDIEGKSQNTTLNGNIYVDYVYNKKSFSVSIFNLKSADYATIRGFYDRQFTLNEFPLLSIPELNISEMPVFFEIGSREINSQCIVTDKLTLKFRETAQQ